MDIALPKSIMTKTLVALVLFVGLLYGLGKFLSSTSDNATALSVTEIRIDAAMR